LNLSAFRAWPEVDRLLALALQEYEDGICAGCGMPLAQSMDGDLLDEWTTAHPHRCGGCTALAKASERAEKQKREYPGALRYIVGLRAGWEAHKAASVAARAERAATDQ
jgi:hypothetical protein